MRTMSGFRRTQHAAYCLTKMLERSRLASRTPRSRAKLRMRVRAAAVLGVTLGVVLGSYLVSASTAHAADPHAYVSEIITPAGWELQSTARACWWEREGSSAELVTPKGWDEAKSREMLTWSGCVCSDLVEPAEWHRMRAASERRAR
jgi:hypothetical protein